MLARQILRSKKSRQAGASADLVQFKNPDQAPVFFLDGEEHAKKRRKTQRFLSPKVISEQHYQTMRRVTDELITSFKRRGHAKLEDLSFSLAIEVVGEIIGLTNSNKLSRAKRIEKVLTSSISNAGNSKFGKLKLNFKRLVALSIFYWFDVRPAINERKHSPKPDAISLYIEEGYSKFMIVIECVTYGTAGMLTTREFIIMAAWYLFDDPELLSQFLEGDDKEQIAILMEIVRLEPVAAMIHRRTEEEIEGVTDQPLPPGEKYGIDIRNINVDKNFVGQCPFSIDTSRAKAQKDSGRFLSFGDGPHGCPGWQVALHETRIFLDQLFRTPGLKLEREPDISWNAQLGSYELRNADISCEM
ncbi:cytochrome P450 [Zhongshania aquimaris]|uniref:Cytochrome P450 n=1 Tax=Zhongshania aquimaris TaxID=2857107 RepID=A0ABS6VYL8_9GAMM|nr:cytochrome P450 [Zhongshania aquimaris]MBW2942731.1 cytochrome P450 [Zhongshania aquimaris]